MAAPAIKYTSPQDYLAMEAVAEEKHEYFDGQIVAMAGAKEAHNLITANVIGELHSFLKSQNLQCSSI